MDELILCLLVVRESLLCRCAKYAIENNYKVFGIHFYAICYGTKKDMAKISLLKPSTDCWTTSYKECSKDPENLCSGGEATISLYTSAVNKLNTWILPINGGYGSWSEWSKCPVTCGYGFKERNRLCNNPPPANEGADCYEFGDSKETMNCYNSLCPVENHLAFRDCKLQVGEEFYHVETVSNSSFTEKFCSVINLHRAKNINDYTVLAEIYSRSDTGKPGVGLLFNAKDVKNYEFAYIYLNHFQSHNHVCYVAGAVINGYNYYRYTHSGLCEHGVSTEKWIKFKLTVKGKDVKFHVDDMLVSSWKAKLPNSGLGGVVIRNTRKIEKAFFYKFLVI